MRCVWCVCLCVCCVLPVLPVLRARHKAALNPPKMMRWSFEALLAEAWVAALNFRAWRAMRLSIIAACGAVGS